MSAAVTAWMLFSLVVGTVVSLAAVAAAAAQRTARRPERGIWLVAIAVIITLGAVAPLRQQQIAVGTVAGATTPVAGLIAPTPTDAPVSQVVAGALRLLAAPGEFVLRTAQRGAAILPLPVHQSVAVLWLLASVVAVIVFAVSYARLRRQMTRWPSQRIDNLTVRVAPSVGPAVIGLAPPHIVVPRWLLHRPAEEQRLVVVHEDEHVRAGDPWLLLVAALAVAAMPWNPALWFAFSRLRLAVELDCDRRVLARGASAAAYGALLIDLSALRSASLSAAPAFTCNASFLERRLLAMTSLTSRLSTPRRIVGVLIAAAALATACETTLPTAAELATMDGAAVVQKATPLAAMDGANVRYFVDGVAITAEKAKAIDANTIASVNVSKEDGGNGVVRITTRYAVKADVDRAPSERTVAGEPLGNVALDYKTKLDAREAESRSALRLRGPLAKAAFDGLLVVDGAIVDASVMKTLSPDRIASVDVLKNAAATAAYSDPRAANGVIRITTRKQ